MNILVCGGAGYVGSHTVRKLLNSNFNVLILDNLSKGHKKAVMNAPFLEVDLANKGSVEEVFRTYKIDAVIQFAANSLVGESMTDPGIYYRNNVVNTLNLLECMVAAKVNTIIFSSTAAVYGSPLEIPITEEHPTNPTNPYGTTKLVVEGMLQWFEYAYGLKFISLRYFNAAGADCTGDIGEDHNPESHLIPLVLKVALGILPEVKIYGTNYPTPDGTCIRDYIHVNDLAKAHVLALEYLTGGGRSSKYNLGNGNGFSVMQVINTACEVTGQKIKTIEWENRPGDPAVLIASSEKIKKELGWQPRYPEIKQIIDSAWNWHSQHPKGFVD